MKRTLTLVLSLVFFAFSLKGQDIISTKETLHIYSKKRAHLWFHNGKELNIPTDFMLHPKFGEIEVVDGKEVLIKGKNINFKIKGEETLIEDYVFFDSYMVTIHQHRDKPQSSIYIQRWDYQLNPIGEPKKILEFDSYHPRPKIQAYGNQKSKTILVKYRAIEDFGFVKLVKIDKDFNVVNTFTQKVKAENNRIDLQAQRILDNGEVFFILAESDEKYLKSYDLIHFSGDDPERIELVPGQNKILNSNLSINFYNDRISVSLLAKDENRKKRDKATLTVYNYDFKTETVDRNSYGINFKELMPKSRRSALDFKIEKSRLLADGSTLFFVSDADNAGETSGDFYDRYMLIIKIDKTADVEWLKILKRNKISPRDANLNNYLDYIPIEGTMEMVFNALKRDFKDGVYQPSNRLYTMKVRREVIPVKATIDLISGDISIQKMNFGNTNLYALSLVNAQNIDGEIGKYVLKAYIDRKPQLTVVDFK